MRHRVRGRHLGRTPSHRKAMFRNMAASLIKTVRADPEEYGSPRVAGRITTTVAKAKELRPFIEKLITLARKALPMQREADELNTNLEKNTSEWKQWRESDNWNEWNQSQAPVLALRRRAFSLLRDNEAVDILFDELATKFEDRNGGYTRIVKLASRRLGDAGQQALIEFVGERDRVKASSAAPVVTTDEEEETTSPASDDSAPVDEAASEEAVADESSTEESEEEKSE